MIKEISAKGRLCCSILFSALVAALLVCCRAPEPFQSNQLQAGPKHHVLFYQKTPCYGTCPAFDARIYSDGSVILKAWADVPFTDTLQGQLTRKELNRLIRDINHLPWQGWNTTYLSSRTDQPSTITTFYDEDREVKSIRHQEGGPEKLLIFQKRMDALLMGVISRSMQEKP